MLKDEKFKFDIANIQKDFAIENMRVNADEISILKKYYNNEITVNEMVNTIKNSFGV